MEEVIILCGGKGTRLSEETKLKPKPMVEIGGKPILWHIMKSYSNYGYKKFILALGYKGYAIKDYFYNARINQSDFTIKMDPLETPTYHNTVIDNDWEISFIDTGEETLKGGRIKQLEKYIKNDNFFVTYGDGVADINIKDLLNFHKSHKRIATVSAVRPPSRFGEILIENDNVLSFEEKPQMKEGFINGGFFVFNREIFKYLQDKVDCDLEFGALQKIAENKQMNAFKHYGFWQCMDNIREKNYLNELSEKGKEVWLKTK
ncbi:MAG: glucose-1-phosphate cytidylyltransferase [Flavobacteriaceae bacterium]|jgi:glucose-1-phosphate cytidylyltransferase|nr:glucose-1-phosphate cytidylyltransferase [Flavobacteriaceae bacterium]